MRRNEATTETSSSIVTEHGSVPEQPPPRHPVKTARAAAVAVSTTLWPAGNFTEQVAPQSIPGGTVVTVPAPLPSRWTTRRRVPPSRSPPKNVVLRSTRSASPRASSGTVKATIVSAEPTAAVVAIAYRRGRPAEQRPLRAEVDQAEDDRRRDPDEDRERKVLREDEPTRGLGLLSFGRLVRHRTLFEPLTPGALDPPRQGSRERAG